MKKRMWYGIALPYGPDVVDEQGYLIGSIHGFVSKRERAAWIDRNWQSRREIPARHPKVRRAIYNGEIATETVSQYDIVRVLYCEVCDISPEWCLAVPTDNGRDSLYVTRYGDPTNVYADGTRGAPRDAQYHIRDYPHSYTYLHEYCDVWHKLVWQDMPVDDQRLN